MDIVERLRSCGNIGLAIEAAQEIERMRKFESRLISAFRINMMFLIKDFTHERFDEVIEMLRNKK